MSWNVTRTSIDPLAVEDELRRDYADFKARYNAAVEEIQAMDEQFEAVLNAVRIILQRKVVGDALVNVTLSGHANPGHRPRQGWANDAIHISVVQS